MYTTGSMHRLCFKQVSGKNPFDNLHIDVVFVHDLVQAVVLAVHLVEAVIVNVCHYHLETQQFGG